MKKSELRNQINEIISKLQEDYKNAEAVAEKYMVETGNTDSGSRYAFKAGHLKGSIGIAVYKLEDLLENL